MGAGDYRAPLDGVTRYTSWEKVPGDWHTRTQLGRMDPPRKPAPGAVPRGQVLYHGNSYAPLYALDDTVAKRPVSDAQRAALDQARELRRVCRLCGGCDLDEYGDPVPLGRGRVCTRCWVVQGAYREHLEARDAARRLHERMAAGTAVVLAVDAASVRDVADLTRIHRVVMVGRGLHVDVPVAAPGDGAPAAGALAPVEAFAEITRRLQDSPDIWPDGLAIICWADADRVRRRLTNLLREAAPATAPPVWLADSSWYELCAYYVHWFAEPDAAIVGYRPDWRASPTGMHGAAGQRARAAEAALEAIVTDHPGAVSPRAPWVTHPAALADTDTQEAP
ncbi:hypothetical protein [Actinomadura rubrisoli]|uniref:Uncharacterized protein n=1 Tax=Actinomadura rubrisoli TaxID=2530368 RepID=A0A4R5ARI9_9ACTN|nr:hypothetical protein [Actinomadura rubrisoli]TDD74835.1 hypothetical protein E1298_32080 [Actinomadura rubrisoli]